VRKTGERKDMATGQKKPEEIMTVGEGKIKREAGSKWE